MSRCPALPGLNLSSQCSFYGTFSVPFSMAAPSPGPPQVAPTMGCSHHGMYRETPSPITNVGFSQCAEGETHREEPQPFELLLRPRFLLQVVMDGAAIPPGSSTGGDTLMCCCPTARFPFLSPHLSSNQRHGKLPKHIALHFHGNWHTTSPAVSAANPFPALQRGCSVAEGTTRRGRGDHLHHHGYL